MNDQDESYINTKIIKDNELLWVFDREVIQQCTGLSDFFRKVESNAFRSGFSDKDQFDPLSECFKECVTARHHLEGLIKSMKNKEASFKVQICDFMQKFEVRFYRGTQSSFEVSHTGVKGTNVYDLKKANEFKDKVLLIVNSNQDDSEINTMRKFVEFINLLNETAEVYAEMDDLGYFEDYINPEQAHFIVSNA